MQLLMTVDNPKPQNGMRLNAAKLLLNTEHRISCIDEID